MAPLDKIEHSEVELGLFKKHIFSTGPPTCTFDLNQLPPDWGALSQLLPGWGPYFLVSTHSSLSPFCVGDKKYGHPPGGS